MARPKHYEGSITAAQRIENAFWELLEETPLNKITISMLSDKAKVNHNTIYYYFKGGIYEMTQKFLKDNIPTEFPDLIFNLSKEITEEKLKNLLIPRNVRIWKRFYLIQKHTDDVISHQAREIMLTAFLKYHKFEINRFTESQKMELNFIFNGYIDILITLFEDKNLSKLHEFMQSPLGQGIRKSISAFPRNE